MGRDEFWDFPRQDTKKALNANSELRDLRGEFLVSLIA